MKKLPALILTLVMVSTLMASVAFAEDKTYNMPEMNTTDPIVLTFRHHHGDSFTKLMSALGAKFTEKYPNITIEIVDTLKIGGDVDGTLTQLLADNNLPDFGFGPWWESTLEYNKICYDLTEFAENDEEYQTKVPYGLRMLGYMLDDERCFVVPATNRPFVAYLNKTFFEEMNVDMPDRDTWTLENLMEYMQTMTDYSTGKFAWAAGATLSNAFTPSMTENAISVGGYQLGGTVDLTNWLSLIEFEREAYRLNQKALNGGHANWMKDHPDDANVISSGDIAIYIDSLHMWRSCLNKNLVEKGIEYVPYFIPAAEGVENAGLYTYCDTGYISATCEHPREAWEAMKYLCWGYEGWTERVELYKTLTKDGTDELLYPDGPSYLPISTDEVLNEKVAALFKNFDHFSDWKGLFDSTRNLVTAYEKTSAGYMNWFWGPYFQGDYNGETSIETAIHLSKVDWRDYVDMLNETFHDYHVKGIQNVYNTYGEPSK